MDIAKMAKINISDAQLKRFSGNYDTFLTKRFDRTDGKSLIEVLLK